MQIKNLKEFIKNIECFEPHYQYDPTRYYIFNNGRSKWYYLVVSFYNGVYYMYDKLSDNSIEFKKDGSLHTESNVDLWNVNFWNTAILYANKYAGSVKKNWLKSYEILHASFPYKYRKGVLLHSIANGYCKEMIRVRDMLGQKKTIAFFKLVDSRLFEKYEAGHVNDLTAKKYFDYCKVAYLHSNIKMDEATKKLTGREMYKLYADGRHEGLLDIKQDSVEEFTQWMNEKHPKKTTGGHPWEILRGGNTTKISLMVWAPDNKKENTYKVSLMGDASSRLAEIISVALGLAAANLPVAIDKTGDIRKRLMQQDNIGIVPEYDSLHRANQSFDEDVYDVMYLSDFGRYKKKVENLISWEGLPCLRPK